MTDYLGVCSYPEPLSPLDPTPPIDELQDFFKSIFLDQRSPLDVDQIQAQAQAQAEIGVDTEGKTTKPLRIRRRKVSIGEFPLGQQD